MGSLTDSIATVRDSEIAAAFPEGIVARARVEAARQRKQLWLLSAADDGGYCFLFHSTGIPVKSRFGHCWVDSVTDQAGSFYSHTYRGDLRAIFTPDVSRLLLSKIPILLLEVENGWVD